MTDNIESENFGENLPVVMQENVEENARVVVENEEINDSGSGSGDSDSVSGSESDSSNIESDGDSGSESDGSNIESDDNNISSNENNIRPNNNTTQLLAIERQINSHALPHRFAEHDENVMEASVAKSLQETILFLVQYSGGKCSYDTIKEVDEVFRVLDDNYYSEYIDYIPFLILSVIDLLCAYFQIVGVGMAIIFLLGIIFTGAIYGYSRQEHNEYIS